MNIKNEQVEKENKISNIRIADYGISIGLTALFLLIMSLVYDVTYEINDDVMILNILSGRIFNMDAASYYLSIELGTILKLLYSIIPGVSWYGLMLIFCYGIGLFLILHRGLSFFDKIKNKVLCAILVILIFSALFFRYCILIHYTVTAAFVGAVGIALFITSDIEKNKKSIYASIVLFWLSYLIRENIGLMLLPFVFIAFIFLILRDEMSSIRKYLPYAIVFLAGFMLLFFINHMTPTTKEWKEYKEYNDIRTTVYDYVLIDESDEKAMEYYKSRGLSEEDVYLYDGYDVMLDDEDSKEKLNIFADYYNIKNEGVSFTDKAKKAVYSYIYRVTKEKNDRPLGTLAIFLYIVSVGSIIVTKKYRYLIIPVLSGCYRSAFWSYLYFKGRYPDRVLISLFFMEIMLLLAVLFELSHRYSVNTWLRAALYTLIIVGMCIVLVYQCRSLSKDYKKQLSVNQTYDVLYLYMDSHPDNFYFLDVFSVCNYTEKAILNGNSENKSDNMKKDSDAVNRKNHVLIGGWITKHPQMNKLFNYQGVANAKDAINNKGCLLVSEQKDGPDKESFEKWLGTELEEIDKVVSNDKVFIIYRVSTDE